MGGTVSTGEDNDDLVDNLMEQACITSPAVEQVFRAVDRAFYFTDESKHSAYKDTAWRSDNLHLSAPCIYSSVLENLSLERGQSFLNIGSGTGYVSTMVGLLIGSGGVNHGVEVFYDVVEYAHERLKEFQTTSTAVDLFDFCPPQFIWGNGLLLNGGRQYDRVYCGARCPSAQLPYLKHLLKVGGVLVVPVNDHLKRIERLGASEWDVQNKLSVSFAPLIEPRSGDSRDPEPTLPALVPASLQQLCRVLIRRLLRDLVCQERPDLAARPRASPEAVRRRPPPEPRRGSRQARRFQRLVLPMLNDLEDEEVRQRAGGDAEPEPEEAEEGRHRRQLRHFGEVLYGAVTRMAREGWGRVSDRADAPDDGSGAEEHDSADSADSDSELDRAENNDDDDEGQPAARDRPAPAEPPVPPSRVPRPARAQRNSAPSAARGRWAVNDRPASDTLAIDPEDGSADGAKAEPIAGENESDPTRHESAGATLVSSTSDGGRLSGENSATAADEGCDTKNNVAPESETGAKIDETLASLEASAPGGDAPCSSMGAATDRTSLKRTSEAAAASAHDAQKRGRRDRQDSGSGDVEHAMAVSPPATALVEPTESHRPINATRQAERAGSLNRSLADVAEEPESSPADANPSAAGDVTEGDGPTGADAAGGGGTGDGAAGSDSSETEEGGDPPEEEDDDSEDGRRRAPTSFVIGLPAGGHAALPRRLRILDTPPSDDDDDGYPEVAHRRRRRRTGPRTEARARAFSELLRQRVSQLPLPPQLRLYVNLDRPF